MAGRLRICLIILGLLLNANSNLRAPIGQAFGIDPFERVVEYSRTKSSAARARVDNEPQQADGSCILLREQR